MPPIPLTELAAGAAQAHEAFTAFTEAGFTGDQALQIVIAMIVAASGKGTE